MKRYISQIFERLNLQQIRECLLHGSEEYNVDQKTYEERIDEYDNMVRKALREKFSGDEEFEKYMAYVYDYSNAIQNVYMEIGLQCGFILALKITNIRC